MADPDLNEIKEEARAAWKRYIDLLIPFRPDLHRYCLGLTGNIWDAEDLAQETVVRGFGALSHAHQDIKNPRGYLVRIASNCWIDSLRRRASEATAWEGADLEPVSPPSSSQRADVRAAGKELMQRLAPQERAAVLMKDVFDMGQREIAEALSTTEGAVKAALHRGRSRLEASEEGTMTNRPVPSAELVDRFVDMINDSNLEGLLSLMHDTATVQEVGNLVEVGRDQFEREGSFLWQAVYVHPDLPAEVRPPKWRNERATVDGEPLMISFGPTPDGEKLMGVNRIEELDGKISRVRAYVFTPETVRAVGDMLGLPVLTGLYRFPF